MSKEKKDKIKGFEDGDKLSVRDIEEKMKFLKKLIAKQRVTCNHFKNGNGKVLLKEMRDDTGKKTGWVRCKACEVEFNVMEISDTKLTSAIATLHDAIHQIIIYSEPSRDSGYTKVLGQMDLNLSDIAKNYSDIVRQNGKKKKKNKKKKNNKNSLGGYLRNSVF